MGTFLSAGVCCIKQGCIIVLGKDNSVIYTGPLKGYKDEPVDVVILMNNMDFLLWDDFIKKPGAEEKLQ